MLWLIQGDRSSDMIVGCNISKSIKDTNLWELWATRTNGKTMVIFTSPDMEEVKEVKHAIDTAIQVGDPVFEIA